MYIRLIIDQTIKIMKKTTLLLLALVAGFTINAQIVIIDQPNDSSGTGNSIVSFEGNNGIGVYTSDDFVITEDTTLGEIDIYGILSSGANFTNLLNFNLFIYTDSFGLPAGDPSQPGTGIIELTNISSDDFTLTEDGSGVADFTVRVTDANGSAQITLTPGTYWICAFPIVDEAFDPLGLNRWNWNPSATVAGVEPVLIDPTNIFGASATTWTNITGLIGEPFVGTAFQIRDEMLLSINDFTLEKSVSLFPNPTNGELNIDFSKELGSTNINIVNTIGQTVINTSFEGIGRKTINTNNLATGVYFAQITAESGNTTIKFIKN